jgi:hypothetical protein
MSISPFLLECEQFGAQLRTGQQGEPERAANCPDGSGVSAWAERPASDSAAARASMVQFMVVSD